MLSSGYRGRILPVNPDRKEVQGLPCFTSVAELPEAPEAGIIAVAAKDAPGVVEQLGAKGCQSVTLFSAGFAETGVEGGAAQAALLSIARRYGMRVVGLNTLGVYNVDIGYYGTFSSSLEMAFPLPGNIGIASQSGAYGAHLSAVARSRGLGASVLVTTGNEVDVTVADAIGWMAASDTVDVICAYQEGFRDAGRLIAALDAARVAGKPVFLLKAGAVLAEHGAIRVRDI